MASTASGGSATNTLQLGDLIKFQLERLKQEDFVYKDELQLQKHLAELDKHGMGELLPLRHSVSQPNPHKQHLHSHQQHGRSHSSKLLPVRQPHTVLDVAEYAAGEEEEERRPLVRASSDGGAAAASTVAIMTRSRRGQEAIELIPWSAQSQHGSAGTISLSVEYNSDNELEAAAKSTAGAAERQQRQQQQQQQHAKDFK